jgi:hypothetical protein
LATLAERNFNASMRLLKKVEATCATLPALSELRTLSELTARARIVRSALNARWLFENLQKHLGGLTAALADFEARKRRIASGFAAPSLLSMKARG